jgi:cytochrome c biogenesis protein ResB
VEIREGRQEGGKPETGGAPRLLGAAHSLLVSPKLAIALLVVVLGCCVVGVTFVRGRRATELIFSSLWFNSLLVLLAVSSATAFFSRIWKRKLTLVSAGMIVFHLSFAAMLGGIAYNRLFFFDGVMRLTEGETLPNGRPDSYDQFVAGRFFDPSTLRGETTLLRMHRDYKVDGQNKRAAYEIAVSDGDALLRRVIYVTEYLDFEGVRFFCQKEGYSVLLVMSEGDGREIFGAHLPLQSLPMKDGGRVYATGTSTAMEPIPFPPDRPRAALQLQYRPNTVVDREGEVTLDVWPLQPDGKPGERHGGTVVVGAELALGGLRLSPREVRFWVGMNVRHDPGLWVVLSSLTLGLVGVVLTFVGRLRQGAARKRSGYDAGAAQPSGFAQEG